jgi:hypothetical protein
MRLPNENEDLVGKVCVCSVGRPGVVVGRKTCDFGDAWIGLGLDGKGNWASTAPCIVAESGKEFYDRLSIRFGGKMSYNS